MKYRKKPVTIEAVRFYDDAGCIEELSALGLDPVRISYKDGGRAVLLIHTLEGTMEGQIGDYIIKGVNGEFYPCKPEIFAKTYESAEERG